jgi:hypothetical protein
MFMEKPWDQEHQSRIFWETFSEDTLNKFTSQEKIFIDQHQEMKEDLTATEDIQRPASSLRVMYCMKKKKVRKNQS